MVHLTHNKGFKRSKQKATYSSIRRYVLSNMKVLVTSVVALTISSASSASEEQCKDLSNLVKYSYSPKESHTRTRKTDKVWGIDKRHLLSGLKIDKNHELYGKRISENIYCLEKTPKICDQTSSWLPINYVKLSITKGKKFFCNSHKKSLTLNNGKYLKESIYYFYTEK